MPPAGEPRPLTQRNRGLQRLSRSPDRRHQAPGDRDVGTLLDGEVLRWREDHRHSRARAQERRLHLHSHVPPGRRSAHAKRQGATEGGFQKDPRHPGRGRVFTAATPAKASVAAHKEEPPPAQMSLF